MTLRFSLALVALLASAPAGLCDDSIATELHRAIDQVDTMVAAEFAKDHLGGVTVGLVSPTGLFWTKSYGYADMEKKVPASRDTVYRIGSITKQFTGLMLLQLIESGQVHLSDPVEKYFPDFNKVRSRFPNAPAVTFVQLATMTSGLSTEPNHLATYTKGPVSDWEKTLIRALPETSYAFEPGTRLHYSNVGYAILGAALSRCAGHPFVDYVQERIFSPLGMTHSAFEPTSGIRAKLAVGYAVTSGKPDTAAPQREHEGRGYKVPNGAIYSTVDDLARFVAFELGGGPDTVLPQGSLASNFRRVTVVNGDLKSGYGIGFMVFRQGDLVFRGHSGAVAGYQAEAYVESRSQLGIIILRNVSGGKFHVGRLALQALEQVAAAERHASP
jgi:CubicO group peptidase (beta-lactamase class C family)